jgi:hypothetical protein
MELKKMKRIVRLAVILLALLALASCYWRPAFSSGGLTVDVSGIKPRVEGEVFRIYLIADGLLFSTGDGAPFVAEVPLTVLYGEQQKIAIDGLPVGPKYKAIVGMGSNSSGVFYPYSFGESAQFVITPNADTVVTIPQSSMLSLYYTAYYSPDLLGKNLKGLVDDSYSVFTAEERKIYSTSFDIYSSTWILDDTYDLVADPWEFGTSSYLVNGISKGNFSSNTFLDTNKGILPFNRWEGWYFEPGFSTALSTGIRQSGSFGVTTVYTDNAVFFRRDGGLGGTYVAYDIVLGYPTPDTWKWVNLDIAGVTDMLVSNYNAYYAANGIAFALPPAFLLAATPSIAALRIDLPSPAPVQSLGFRPALAGAGGTLSLGTTDGVWQVGVDETTGVVSSAPTQILETAGDSIERIAISSYNSRAEAYLSRYYLYIRNWNGSSYYVDKMPFFAVVPGRATGLAWDLNGTLYISGTEGLSAIYVGYSIC